MRITFDIFHGDRKPLTDFIEWQQNWWYRSAGLPLEKGTLPNGDEWILAGWFFGEDRTENIVRHFMKDTDVETLFRADGQFILCIFSGYDNSVRIYRDRIGIFPLVYCEGGNGIIISTWLDTAMDISGTNSIASTGFLEQWPIYRKTFSPYTPFSSVKSLSGHNSLCIVNNEVSEISHDMYFPKDGKYRNLNSASRELGNILSQSVRKRINSDQKLGVLLSGGNDSSLVVALIREYYTGILRTLFVTFEGNPRDYGKDAESVAKRFDTEHMAIRLTPRDYVQHWAYTVKALQTPLPMPCHVAISYALKELSNDVDTMVGGDGADTVFGGSLWPQLLLLSGIGMILPMNVRNNIAGFSKKIPDEKLLGRAFGMILKALGTPLREYPHVSAAVCGRESADKIFSEGSWQKSVEFRRSLAEGDFFKGLFAYLMLHGIPEDIATSARLGFHHNIISVYPFLDYQLIESSLRLPNYLRYHYSTKKASLKRYCMNYFDKTFIYKPKEGFGVPLSAWFTRKEFDPFLRMPLEGRSIKRQWWMESELKKVIDIHTAGHGSDRSAESIPWIAANMELWARICLDGDSPDLYK